MASGKDFRVIHPRARQVRQQHAESDGQQQQRLKAAADGEVHQHEGNENHDDGFPVGLLDEHHDTGLVGKILERLAVALRALLGRFGGLSGLGRGDGRLTGQERVPSRQPMQT